MCLKFENNQIFDWKSGNFLFVNLQVSVVMASVLLTWVDDDNSDSMDQQRDSDDQTEPGNNAENSKEADNKVSYTKLLRSWFNWMFHLFPKYQFFKFSKHVIHVDDHGVVVICLYRSHLVVGIMDFLNTSFKIKLAFFHRLCFLPSTLTLKGVRFSCVIPACIHTPSAKRLPMDLKRFIPVLNGWKNQNALRWLLWWSPVKWL